MQENCRARLAATLVSLFFFVFLPAAPSFAADDKDQIEATGHQLRAERALNRKEYRTATVEYRMAAEKSPDVQVARKATQLAYAYQFHDEALLAAKRWVKLDSDSDEAKAYLGQIYFRLEDDRRAAKLFDKLIKADPDGPGNGLLTLVGRLSEEDQPARADKMVRKLARRHKKSALAQYAVAVAALRAGDSEHAKERLVGALELEPGNSRAQLLYARALMFEGDEDGAIEYLAHIINDNPQPDPDARMELALIYMLSGRDEDALSQVNQVLMEQTGRDDALRLMAIINYRLERYDAAWDDFQDLLSTGKYRMDAVYYLARIADYRGEHERAVRLYSEVRYGSFTLFSQRRASALLAHELDDVEGAIELLDDFAEASPNNAVEMMVTKAQLLVSLGRYDEGLAIYETASSYRPDDEGMALGRAELLLRTGRLKKAIAAYRDAVKRWPESALSLNALGYTLVDRTDELDEAEDLIRKALSYAPDNPAIIDSLGWVLFKRGEHEAALVELQRAYDGFPDHEVAAHIVEVLVALERKDEALEMLESAEAINEDSELLDDVRKRFFTPPKDE